MGTVSIPEKTLEHWASIYLTNRFPWSKLWWPADGEDVAIGDLLRGASRSSPSARACLLELKTTTWEPLKTSPFGRHELKIDGAQLARYLYSPSRVPVYYVFPAPFWLSPVSPGVAAPKPALGGSIGYAGSTSTRFRPEEWWRRLSEPEWFGNWLYVVRAESLWDRLSPRERYDSYIRRSRTGAGGRLPVKVATNVARSDPDGPVGWTWKIGASLTPVPWPDFWQRSNIRSFWSSALVSTFALLTLTPPLDPDVVAGEEDVDPAAVPGRELQEPSSDGREGAEGDALGHQRAQADAIDNASEDPQTRISFVIAPPVGEEGQSLVD